jgi:Zn-dependent peptidase ImmA (M78 family)
LELKTMRRKQQSWTSAAARRIVELAGDAPTVEAAVTSVARRLLDGVPCPPTDLDVLKNRLNVRSFEPIEGLPISGELRADGSEVVIHYSATLPEPRKRFTIAHELGHAVLESTGPNCPRVGRELERICDMLATEFLMPRHLFGWRASEGVGPQQVYELAREFQTSIMATALRCKQLLNVSIFQVEDATVTWGYGAVRRQQDLRQSASEFGEAISRAMRDEAGEQPIVIGRALFTLQWTCSRGRKRALFTMHPHPRATGQGEVVGANGVK